MAEERLQKVLSACGYGSRRDCEKLIASGVVSVNGKRAKLGDKADISSDEITISGNLASLSHTEKTYIILNKPQNVLSDIKRSRNRKIVTDFVDVGRYLFIVGRLDYRSEGLILLTDDGELANKLTHPRYEHQKEYQVLLKEKPSKGQIEFWKNGVLLDSGYCTLPAKVRISSTDKEGFWLQIIMREGKKRQIRETGKSLGLTVKRIIRTRIGPIQMGNLKPGFYRELTTEEIKKLKNYCA